MHSQLINQLINQLYLYAEPNSIIIIIIIIITQCDVGIKTLSTVKSVKSKARFPLPELTARVNGPS